MSRRSAHGATRRNPHGRAALAAAERRARLVIEARRNVERAERYAAQQAADVAARRALIERATERARILRHLAGPRLLPRNEPVRLAALLALTNEPDGCYETWDRS